MTRIVSRDFGIFKALWRWKALSTSAIAARFFPNASPFTAYVRLTRLENAKYLRSPQIGENFSNQVWALDRRGFELIKPELPILQNDGYKSENYAHDCLSTAFHLGEWMNAFPIGSEAFTEQELRRLNPDLWPTWVPKSTVHRPDGLSMIAKRNHQFVFAFETEIHQKEQKRYESPATYYAIESSIHSVLWLVPNSSVQNGISKALGKFDEPSMHKHGFVYIPEFKKYGWNAVINCGDYNLKKVSDLLGIHASTKSKLTPNMCMTSLMLNLQKRPKIQACGAGTYPKNL